MLYRSKLICGGKSVNALCNAIGAAALLLVLHQLLASGLFSGVEVLIAVRLLLPLLLWLLLRSSRGEALFINTSAEPANLPLLAAAITQLFLCTFVTLCKALSRELIIGRANRTNPHSAPDS